MYIMVTHRALRFLQVMNYGSPTWTIIEYKYEYMKPTKRKRLARLPMKLGNSVAKVNDKVSCA